MTAVDQGPERVGLTLEMRGVVSRRNCELSEAGHGEDQAGIFKPPRLTCVTASGAASLIPKFHNARQLDYQWKESENSKKEEAEG